MKNLRKKDLLAALDRMKGIPVLVAGDYMLDKYVWGSVERVSPEAPVPVLVVQREENRPGGAGNVAANVSAMGGNPFAVGLVGKDGDSSDLLLSLQECNVDVGGLVPSDMRPTTTKCRLVAHGQQLVRMDHESSKAATRDEADLLLERAELLVQKVRAVVMQDYNKGVLTETIIQALVNMSRKRSLMVAVDPKLENFFIYHGVTLFKPNEKEVERALRITIHNDDELIAAGRRLQSKLQAELLLVTSGEHGMTLFGKGGEAQHIASRAQEVFDVSGAGDTVIAMMSLALAADVRPAEAAYLANMAAGVCVSKVGTLPVSRDEVIGEIERDRTLG